MERKEAIKIIKSHYPVNKQIINEALEVLIPELRESEDERIREEIISIVKSYRESYIPEGNYRFEDCIAWLEKQKEPELSEDLGKYIAELSKQFPEVSFAKLSRIAVRVKNWLEKQGKETSWKPSKEEMDVLYGLAYITNQYDEHKEEVITRLYQDLKREFFNGASYENMFPTHSIQDDVRRRSTIQVLEYARSLDNYNQYGKADIDKNIAWLEKQGEERTVNYPIEGMFPYTDPADTLDGEIENIWNKLRNCDNTFTAAKSGFYEVIHHFANWLEKQSYTKKDVDDAYLKGICDAKHELEKQGEQKSVDKVEPFDKYEGLTDFERTLADICIGWIGEEPGWKQYIKDNADVLLKIAIEKFNSVQDTLFEQKPAWSEEDIRNIQDIDSILFYDKDLPEETCMRLRNWLKSLKPHTDMVEALRTEYEKGRADTLSEMKSSWSEEDEHLSYWTRHNLTELKNRFGENYGDSGKCIDWIKQLKQRIGG